MFISAYDIYQCPYWNIGIPSRKPAKFSQFASFCVTVIKKDSATFDRVNSNEKDGNRADAVA